MCHQRWTNESIELLKTMIAVPSCDGVLKSNGGIKRKLKLQRMNHLHPSCFTNYHSHRCRKIMNQNKFLLLVMWSICVFIPYGRSLMILLCLRKFQIMFSKCKWYDPYYVFCCNASAIITSFHCTCIISITLILCLRNVMICNYCEFII